jgi:type IV pilus assembly protein PilW
MLRRHFHHGGFSLVELMVAMAIGLFITAGLITLFVDNSGLHNELDRNQAQVENGRYALDLLAEDLGMAGYFGDFDPSGLTLPGSIDNAAVCADSVGEFTTTLSLPVMGQSVGSSDGSLCGVSGVETKAQTDILALRRTSTCISTDSDCLDIDNDVLFQASLCNTESTTPYIIAVGETSMTLHKKDCTALADIRKFLARVYYVSPDHLDGSGNPILNQSGDAIPTLYRLDLVAGSWSQTPLVEGIQALVLEYGIDTSAPGDGSPDSYVTNPASLCGSSDAACIAAQWNSVVAVRVGLLVRTRDPTPGYTDKKTYSLAATSFGPYGDGYKRRVYSTVVQLKNVAGRRAK